MLTVSNQFKNAFRDPRRSVEFKAVVNGVEYGPNQIVELTIRDSLQPSSSFMLGTVVSSELSISLRTPDELSVNAEIRLYLRAANLIWDMATLSWITADTPWNDASSESIPYGVYYVDTRRQVGSYWQYTCYDRLLLAEQPYISQLTYPATMAAVLAEACGLAGIASTVSVPPALTFAVAPTGYSCRGVIGLVAQAMACCVRMNKEGELAFVAFSGAPVELIKTGDYKKLTHTNPLKSISRVVCVIDDEGAALEAGTGSEDNTVTVNNPYLDQAGVNRVQAVFNGFTYHPFSMDWICLPWIEVGDRVTVQEYMDVAWSRTGTRWNETEVPWNGIGTWNTTIMTNTIKYRGGLGGKIEASSDSQQQSEFKPVGSIAQQLQRLNQASAKLGKPYFGVTITKESGLKIERSDGKSDITLNSDVMDWRVNGESRMYYDAQSGKLKYKGDIIMQGGSINWESVGAPTPVQVGALPADSPKLANLSEIGAYLGALHQGQVEGLTGKLANLSSIGDYIGALSQGQVKGLSTRLTKITETGVYTGTVGTDQLIAGSALIGAALIDKIRANQIIVGSAGETIPDSLITSASAWSAKETPTGAQAKASAAQAAAIAAAAAREEELRNNLRITGQLPTSLALNDKGITAYTSDPTKFARLDYRGLYIAGGAIQIDGGLPDGQIAGASGWNNKTTRLDASGLYTGYVKADQIDVATGKIKAAQIEELVVGSNVTMGTGASISWGQVTGKDLDYGNITGSKPPVSADNTYATIGTSRLTHIDKDGIYTRKIDADQINTVGLSAEKIFQRDKPNNYAVMGGDYGDLALYYQGSEYFRIYNALASTYLKVAGGYIFNSDGSTTYPRGSWNFSNASVSGLAVTAKFG